MLRWIPLIADRLGGDSGAVIIRGDSSKLGVLSSECDADLWRSLSRLSALNANMYHVTWRNVRYGNNEEFFIVKRVVRLRVKYCVTGRWVASMFAVGCTSCHSEVRRTKRNVDHVDHVVLTTDTESFSSAGLRSDFEGYKIKDSTYSSFRVRP